MTDASPETYVCCYCFQRVNAAEALTVVISFRGDESQELFCHPEHFAEKLAPGIPFLFERGDED